VELQKRIDDLYQTAFAHAQSNGNESDIEASTTHAATTGLTEEAFGRLGRTQPEVSTHTLKSSIAVYTKLRLFTAFRCTSKQTPAVHIMIGMDLPNLITMQLLKHTLTVCILSTTIPKLQRFK